MFVAAEGESQKAPFSPKPSVICAENDPHGLTGASWAIVNVQLFDPEFEYPDGTVKSTTTLLGIVLDPVFSAKFVVNEFIVKAVDPSVTFPLNVVPLDKTLHPLKITVSGLVNDSPGQAAAFCPVPF